VWLTRTGSGLRPALITAANQPSAHPLQEGVPVFDDVGRVKLRQQLRLAYALLLLLRGVLRGGASVSSSACCCTCCSTAKHAAPSVQPATACRHTTQWKIKGKRTKTTECCCCLPSCSSRANRPLSRRTSAGQPCAPPATPSHSCRRRSSPAAQSRLGLTGSRCCRPLVWALLGAKPGWLSKAAKQRCVCAAVGARGLHSDAAVAVAFATVRCVHYRIVVA